MDYTNILRSRGNREYAIGWGFTSQLLIGLTCPSPGASQIGAPATAGG